MAVTISSAVKTALDNGTTQGCSITISKTGQSTLNLTQRNVDSLVIDRASANGNMLSIGTAIATELTLGLDNHLGTYDDYDFEGATIYAAITVAGESIPLGYFVVIDQPEVNKDIVQLTAYDYMSKLDGVVTSAQWSALTFPCTVANMIVWIGTQCGVSYQNTYGLPNRLYEIDEQPATKNVTFHQLVAWCAEIQGCCAYFNHLGVLSWGVYNTASPAMTLAEGNRYTSNIGGKNITITGVKLTNNDGEEFTTGTTSYMISISGNDLIQSDEQTVVNALGAVYNNFTYRSTSSTTLPYPHLFPCDTLTYTYKKHNGTLVTVSAIISHLRYTMNGKTTIEGKGETTSTYSSSNYGSYISSGDVKANMIQIDGFKWENGKFTAGTGGAMANAPVTITVEDIDTIPRVTTLIGSTTASPYILLQTESDGTFVAKISQFKVYRSATASWVNLEDWLDELDM